MTVQFILKDAQGWGVKKTSSTGTKKTKKTNNITRVIVYLHWSNIRLRVPTGRSVTPDKWDFKNKDSKDNFALHGYLYGDKTTSGVKPQIIAGYEEFRKNNGNSEPSIEEMRAIVEKILNPSKDQETAPKELISYFEKHIRTLPGQFNSKLKTPISQHTVIKRQTTLNLLKEFRRSIPFSTLNADFFTDFQEYLRVKKNYATNTIGTHIKILKTVLYLYNETYPEATPVHIPKTFQSISEQTNTVFLSEEELQQIAALELPERLNNVRDLFLIGCWTGLRYSDLALLQPGNIGAENISITTHKTGRAVVIPILPELRTILNKYFIDGVQTLPRPLSNQNMNEYLKEIMKQVPAFNTAVFRPRTRAKMQISTVQKWEIITMHTARRTFATNMYFAGIPTASIMAVTGHKTEKQFFVYIRETPTGHANIVMDGWKNRNRRAI